MNINDLNTQEEPQDIINQIKENFRTNSIMSKKEHPFTKNDLWKIFNLEFKNLFSKPFFIDNEIAKNLAPIFYYFLESEKFFSCENLRSDITAPSFKKGLLLFGNIGVGKTQTMLVFERIFRKYSPHRFTVSPTYEVVDKYEDIKTIEDRNFFYKYYCNGTILFDDLNAEKMANNYGKVNVLKDLIIRRSASQKKTHLTLNPLPGFDNDINGSLLNLGEIYGQRMVDRMYEMFNVIQLKRKSIRI